MTPISLGAAGEFNFAFTPDAVERGFPHTGFAFCVQGPCYQFFLTSGTGGAFQVVGFIVNITKQPGSGLGNFVPRVFTPVLAKHSKSFSLIDCISVGVDRMQRNFEPMRRQVEAWQRSELTDVTAKMVIYEAFVEGKLEAPRHLARTDLYFEPKYEEFRPRTIWSLSNAFTSAFKELDPIPQFRATAKLGEFLDARFLQSF